MTKKLTYQEAYCIARKKLHKKLGKDLVLIVKNKKDNFRVYYKNEYPSKKRFFPIIVKKL